MKTDPRRFAPLGLVISLLALLSLAGFLLVRGISSAGVIAPLDATLMERGLLISGSAIVLGLAISAILDPESARKFLVGRQVQYGSNSVILFLAFFGILIFINLLAYQNPKTWDLTEGQKNTLATETLSTLASLPEPLTAKAYYTSRMSRDALTKLLDNLQQNSNGKFAYEFSDPELNPVAAQADGVERDGTVILQMGDHKEQVVMPTEQDLTSAMVRLINPEQRVVYFITGHGEPAIDTPGDSSYSSVKTTLEKKNYTVKSLSLLSAGKIPADAKVLVLGGPQTPLAKSEISQLKDFLGSGGALIVMVDPTILNKLGDSPDTLAPLLAAWGITVDNDMVIDPNANPASVAVADPLAYASHPVTEKMRGVNSFYPRARSLQLSAIDGLTVLPLVVTGSAAWGETDFQSVDSNKVSFDPAQDFAGPVTLAAVAENSSTKSRLVVFGNAQFPYDPYYKQGNGDILINAVDWAADRENVISLTPRDSNLRTFNPPGTLGLVGIVLAALCIIPLLVIAGGFSAWYARRKRG